MKHSVPAQTENDLIDFYRNAIRTRSYSNQEGDIAVLILKEMEKLGYDECYIDRVGNVVGRVAAVKKSFTSTLTWIRLTLATRHFGTILRFPQIMLTSTFTEEVLST